MPYPIYKILEALLDILLTFITMNIIDRFLTSISIPSHTEILFAILSYSFSQCVDFFDFGKSSNSKNQKDSDE